MKLSIKETLPIWWAFTWRSVLIGFGGGVILGFAFGFVAGFIGHPEVIPLGSIPIGWVWGVVASIWMFNVAMNKQYRHLRIISSSAGNEPAREAKSGSDGFEPG